MINHFLTKSELLGVEVFAKFNGQPLPVEDDGYVGRFSSSLGAPVIVAAVVEWMNPENVFCGLSIGRSTRDIVPKKDKAPLAEKKLGHVWYQQRVWFEGVNGFFEPVYPKSFRLFAIAMKNATSDPGSRRRGLPLPTGEFELWEIGLTAQDGEVFLICERNYEFRCFRSGGKVVCPMFDEKWPQLAEIAIESAALNFSHLPQYQDDDVSIPAGIPEGMGIVKWFNAVSGTGSVYVQVDGVIKEAKVYWKKIPARPRLHFLKPGEVVRIEELIKPRGSTKFELEAVGVSLIAGGER